MVPVKKQKKILPEILPDSVCLDSVTVFCSFCVLSVGSFNSPYDNIFFRNSRYCSDL